MTIISLENLRRGNTGLPNQEDFHTGLRNLIAKDARGEELLKEERKFLDKIRELCPDKPQLDGRAVHYALMSQTHKVDTDAKNLFNNGFFEHNNA